MDLPSLDGLLNSLNKDLSMINNVDFKSHCQKCDKPVIGEAVQFTQDDYKYFFHKECFQCKECSTLLQVENPFYINKNAPHCQTCYAKLVIGNCDKCQNVMETGSIIKAGGKQYHPTCFTCSGCNTQLSETYFETPDSDFYCKPCHEQEFLPECDSCHQKIFPKKGTSDPAKGIESNDLITSVVFRDKKYHEDCFKCKGCQIIFKDLKVFPIDNEIWCKGCHDQKIVQRAKEMATLPPLPGALVSSEYDSQL